MKRNFLILLIGLSTMVFSACQRSEPKASSPAKTLEQVSEQLSEQFLAQYAKGQRSRKLKRAYITHFAAPNGNQSSFLGIALQWEDNIVTMTGVPLIPLGDGLVGITYTEENVGQLSAVLSFR